MDAAVRGVQADASAARCCEEEYGARVEAMDKRLLAMVRELNATPGVRWSSTIRCGTCTRWVRTAHRREVLRFLAGPVGRFTRWS